MFGIRCYFVSQYSSIIDKMLIYIQLQDLDVNLYNIVHKSKYSHDAES
jgi:hypothetical protein